MPSSFCYRNGLARLAVPIGFTVFAFWFRTGYISFSSVLATEIDCCQMNLLTRSERVCFTYLCDENRRSWKSYVFVFFGYPQPQHLCLALLYVQVRTHKMLVSPLSATMAGWVAEGVFSSLLVISKSLVAIFSSIWIDIKSRISLLKFACCVSEKQSRTEAEC